eukprot:2877168-Prymnesium_polylepis.1
MAPACWTEVRSCSSWYEITAIVDAQPPTTSASRSPPWAHAHGVTWAGRVVTQGGSRVTWGGA